MGDDCVRRGGSGRPAGRATARGPGAALEARPGLAVAIELVGVAACAIRPVAATGRIFGPEDLLVRHHLAQRATELGHERGSAVLEHQRTEVAGVEQLDAQAGVKLAQAADLAILLADQALLESGQLDEELELGQPEVRREALQDVAVQVPQDWKDDRLVLPGDLVEVQDAGQFGFAGVCKGGARSRPAARFVAPSRPPVHAQLIS